MVTQNRWSSESNVSSLRHCRVAKDEDEVKSRKSRKDYSWMTVIAMTA